MARIIVVDDEAGLRRAITRALELEDYEVLEAPNGVELLRLQRLIPADLILLDIFMPHKDGFETMGELRREYPGVKVIAMSGGAAIDSNAETYLVQAQLMGACCTLKKPFELADMVDLVQKTLAEEA